MSNPFEELKVLFTNTKYSLKNPWMVNRLLSYDPRHLYLSIKINQYLSRLPIWAIEDIYKACIRKGNPPYIDYAKMEKKRDKELIKKIAFYLCCSSFHAQQTIEVLRLKKVNPEKLFGLKKGQ